MTSADTSTFYVSPYGSDEWSGTMAEPDDDGTDGPFATLTRAKQAVRHLKKQRQAAEDAITVVVANGVYQQKETFKLTEADSGSPGAPVTYRAADNAQVRITGGHAVKPAAFGEIRDDAVLQRLPKAVRGHVLKADLKALGIDNLGRFPDRFRGVPAAPELFVNDRRMTLARWPNEGWTTIDKIIESGSRPRSGDTSDRPGIFQYKGDRPSQWNVEQGVWLRGYWCFDWYEQSIKVGSIDTDKKQITLAEPHQYSVRQGNPSPRRYYAFNLLEELDAPGEYYIDRASGTLYFWPPESIDNSWIVLSTLNDPIITLDNASHVTIRDFVVEAGLSTGIVVKGGEGNNILACDIRNTRGRGIGLRSGKNHRIAACDIHDTGTGGILLGGGDRRTLTPAGNEAINNHIRRFSIHQLTYASALQFRGVGNRAAHNLIHDAPHMAIGLGGNDHIFEYNIIHHVCMASDDAGALYKGRNPSCRGNVIRYNFWHHIGSPMGHGNAAVYFDDGDGGETVFGNIFFRCGEPGHGNFGTVFSHGGHDIIAENNIFIECKRPLGSSPWNFKRWKAMIEGNRWQKRLLKEVDITKPPYTTHYPGLKGFMDPKPEDERVSNAVRNVIAMCADVKTGNWQVPKEKNWNTDKDPGFVDAANGNFRLSKDAAVFEKLPEFEPIPFEQMGLLKNELRPELPVRKWDYEPPKSLPPLDSRAGRPAPKKGPPPVYKVQPAQSDIAIDGSLTPSEWHGLDKDAAMQLAEDYRGRKADRTGKAWLAYDANYLYVAVNNKIDPETSLDGNSWGSDEAVEVALRTIRGEKKSPIYVVRGYGNGHLQFGKTPSGRQDPGTVENPDIQFAADRPAKDRWTAEMSIPLKALEIDTACKGEIAFSLTVRKALDRLWLQWEGTRGNSFWADRGGRIEFAK